MANSASLDQTATVLVLNCLRLQPKSFTMYSNWFNQSDPLSTVHHFTFSMESSMHSEKACLKWTKVQFSKPRLSEMFAFEAIILMFW